MNSTALWTNSKVIIVLPLNVHERFIYHCNSLSKLLHIKVQRGMSANYRYRSHEWRVLLNCCIKVGIVESLNLWSLCKEEMKRKKTLKYSKISTLQNTALRRTNIMCKENKGLTERRVHNCIFCYTKKLYIIYISVCMILAGQKCLTFPAIGQK